jgi:hypothetical protein
MQVLADYGEGKKMEIREIITDLESRSKNVYIRVWLEQHERKAPIIKYYTSLLIDSKGECEMLLTQNLINTLIDYEWIGDDTAQLLEDALKPETGSCF